RRLGWKMKGELGPATGLGAQGGGAETPLDHREARIGLVAGGVGEPTSSQVVDDDALSRSIGQQAVPQMAADEARPAGYNHLLRVLEHRPAVLRSRGASRLSRR